MVSGKDARPFLHARDTMSTYDFSNADVIGGDRAVVGILMGSASDWPTMRKTAETLEALQIPYERHVISAHRTPGRCAAYAESARDRGLQVIIAAAGLAAHLAGVVAASTPLPVIGVPMSTSMMGGLDSLLSMVQMPKGIPVATVAVGSHGAVNAAVMAARILALADDDVRESLDRYIEEMASDASRQTPWDEE